MAEKTLKFFPVLAQCLQVEISVKFFFVGRAGDTGGRMGAAEVMTDFKLLKEQYFEAFVL